MDKYSEIVLITGVAGFIGSNVLVKMVKKYPEYKFIGIDKFSYCSTDRNFEEISTFDNFKFIKADICDFNFMVYLFQNYKITIVMNFAAYTHVDQSFGNSIIFTKNNVIGTHTLLEASQSTDTYLKKFIHVSTDEVYGSQDTKSTEKSTLDPTNPYAATKAAAEHLVRSYHHSFKTPIIITRGNNVYGPKQYPEKVVPNFITKLSNNEKCSIHGSGTQLRSFLYIDDVVDAFDLIFHKGIIGETYNIGCNSEHSILSVAENILDIMKPGEEFEKWFEHVKDRNFNDHRYYISTEKLEKLGWKPKVFFKEGILKTIEWYICHPHYWNI